MSNKIYIAICAVAIGKSVIQPGKPLPDDTPESKIKQLLKNESIEEVDGGEAQQLLMRKPKPKRMHKQQLVQKPKQQPKL